MHGLYKFRDNTPYNPRFPCAVSILARSEVVDRRCPTCGATEKYPKGAFDVVLEDGSEYPDVLGCGAYPLLIVSEAVIADWMAADITAFHTYPVGIAKRLSEELEGIPHPQYHRVEIDGSCKIDLAASGLRVTYRCPECRHMRTDPSVASGFKMVPDSWGGSPLFRDIDLYPRVTFCTELVLDLARKHQRTNFRFEPMEGPRDSSGKGIDYLEL